MGLNFTLNHCLEYADTEYCARMDGDDVSLPHRFQEEIDFLDAHKEYAIVSGPMIYFDEQGEFRRGKGRGMVSPIDFIHGSPFVMLLVWSGQRLIKPSEGILLTKNY